MRIISANKAENCIDGDFVYKYKFDCAWTKESIQELKVLGQLKYYGSFPKPMFQLILSDGTSVKGVQGTDECRVIYNRDDFDETKKRLENRFEDIFS